MQQHQKRKEKLKELLRVEQVENYEELIKRLMGFFKCNEKKIIDMVFIFDEINQKENNINYDGIRDKKFRKFGKQVLKMKREKMSYDNIIIELGKLNYKCSKSFLFKFIKQNTKD
ncbi:hypothetical protein [Poseidonibacter sp.]|uniref:hypothetical protein n=1 Tax=Poseidonibacter sp. TaxID=2321188 RepID=UPI003C714788